MDVATVSAETSATAVAGAVAEVGAAAEGGAEEAAGAGGPLEVGVRLLEEGALVRWAGGGGRCTLRWYDAAEPAHRLLATVTTQLDYVLGTHYLITANRSIFFLQINII